MLVRFHDFNGSENAIAGAYQQQWTELDRVLTSLPLHLKASDQANIQGRPIFDPVGTNQHVAEALTALGWEQKIVIPEDLTFLGTDVDFAKNGALCLQDAASGPTHSSPSASSVHWR
jgi:hypothetical protein